MTPEELKDRTKKFAIRIIKLVRVLPRTLDGRAIGNQLLRSGTSVAANYRATCRARSHAEFKSKLGVVVEEIDETVFWLELIAESEILPARRLKDLQAEALELFRIFVRSQLTAKGIPNLPAAKSVNS
jgi:four helix bundle protein